MNYPEPVPGLVIRYNYLWRDERLEGRDKGAKDRPCAIVLASKKTGEATPTVTVVPITHSPPEYGEEDLSIEIPLEVCTAIGLDSAGNWIRIGEVNRFVWPGFNLQPRPDDTTRIDYGMIPPDFFVFVRDRLYKLATQTTVPATSRD